MADGKLLQLMADAKAAGWAEWVRSEADERAVLERCWFSRARGERVVTFFRKFLRHSKGTDFAGKPFELLPWQRDDVVMPLFGWMRAGQRPGDICTRRYRRAGIWVPKKNGKSAMASGFTAFCLVGDGEPGSECYSAAADREQASIVFTEFENMVLQSPSLSRLLNINRTLKTIYCPTTSSFYKALSSEVSTSEGKNAHLVVVDELHTQKKPDLYESLRYAGAARRQPLFIEISTAGWDKQTIGYEQYQYAKAVLSGEEVDTAFLPFIAEASPDDDWTSEEVWHNANPSLGVTISLDSFRDDFNEAHNVPRKENSFRRYRLNQWTDAETAWIVADTWNACERDIALDDYAGNDCYMGLDLAKTTDLTALVLAFPSDDNEFAVFPFFFLPKDGIADKERKDRKPYQTWARQGFIELTPGNVTDYGFIRERIRSLATRFIVKELAFDPWNSSHLMTELQDDNFECVEFRQGYKSMSEPTKEFERLVLCEKLVHDGNPILTWNIGNVSVKTDPAGNVKPDKQSSKSKIDGAVAAIMAVERARVRAGAADPLIEVW